MPTVESKPIRIQVHFLAESERGYTIGRNGKSVWLPRRLVELQPAGCPVGELCTAILPDWLAHEAGLLSGADPTRYSIAKPL